MDTQHERGLADRSETLATAQNALETATDALHSGAIAGRQSASDTVHARIYGVYPGMRTQTLDKINTAVNLITDAEEALRLARAAIERLPE